MNITDDSLSYIDHALFEKVLNTICVSFTSQIARKAITLEEILETAFQRFHDPSYDGRSEAWKFKMMISDIWKCSIVEKDDLLYQDLENTSVREFIPIASISGMNFSKLCAIPTRRKCFLAYIKDTLDAAKRYAISPNQLRFGIDITGQGSYFIRLALIGEGGKSIKYAQSILQVQLDIVGAKSREYIICRNNSLVQKNSVFRTLDILGAWFREMIGGNKRYDADKHLSAFIKRLERKVDARNGSGLEALHLAAGGKSLLAHRTMFSLVPENATRISRNSRGPKLEDLIWNRSYVLTIKDSARKELVKLAPVILGVSLRKLPCRLREFAVEPFHHQMIEHCEERNHFRCRKALEILSACVDATDSKMRLEMLHGGGAMITRKHLASESRDHGDFDVNNVKNCKNDNKNDNNIKEPERRPGNSNQYTQGSIQLVKSKQSGNRSASSKKMAHGGGLSLNTRRNKISKSSSRLSTERFSARCKARYEEHLNQRLKSITQNCQKKF